MKRLKKLGAIVVAAGIISLAAAPALAFNVPEYNSGDATSKKIEGNVTTYNFDRNNDGVTDRVLKEIKKPESTAYINGESVTLIPGYKKVKLFLNDDYEGGFNRRLIDSIGPKGLGADGKFEMQIKY